MKRRKLLAALAVWLAVPALASAQADASRFSREPRPLAVNAPIPSHLPEPKAPVAGDVPVEPIAKPQVVEIGIPKKSDAKPTVTIEELPYDSRPNNQRWLRRHSGPVEEAVPDSPARFAFTPAASYQVWAVPEWIVWKTTGMHLPPLVTGSSVGTDQTDSGVIGVGDTRVLFGNESQSTSFRSGVRARVGFWFDSTQTLGLEAGLFYLGQKSSDASFSTSGNPVSLARPFFDVLNGVPSSEVIGFSSVDAVGNLTSTTAGSLLVRATTDFWGGDFNLRRYIASTGSVRVDGLLGFRYQRLRDTLETNSISTINADDVIGGLASGTALRIQDMFHTTSNFYGGQFGLYTEWQAERWFVGLTGKLAMGMVKHEVRINGLTTITDPGATTSQVTIGGLLAQGTNIGRFRTSRFSVIPEIGLNVGYEISSSIRLFAGYSVLYWSNVIRPGDQIDLTVNTTQVQRSTTDTAILTGPPRPAYGAAFRESGYWAHGGNLGLELRW
jgi:Putative beta barrel porin-7 (BBP7)